MANRVLAINKLTPPYDLEQLARQYGDLEFHDFPFAVDGITIGIGGEARPKILINVTIPVTRRKFTLAHEIGHIVIPWHTGTIVTHIDPGEVDFAYMQMEAEANRFAAELLMPTDWLDEEFKHATTVESYLRSVLSKVGASKEATFYKVFRNLAAPVVCIQVDSLSRLVNAQRSPTAPYTPARDTPISRETFHTDNRFESFEIDGQQYLSWVFVGRDIEEVDQRPWRDVFSEILDDTGMRERLQSINAILAASFNKNRTRSEAEICGAIIRAFVDRGDYRCVFQHSLFEQYVIKRVKELKQRT
ncbi:hypothetical protein ACVWYU_001467 [Pseudomonas sp. TE12234]